MLIPIAPNNAALGSMDDGILKPCNGDFLQQLQ